VKVLLVEVNKDPRGPQLIVSRSHPGLIRRLFEQEGRTRYGLKAVPFGEGRRP